MCRLHQQQNRSILCLGLNTSFFVGLFPVSTIIYLHMNFTRSILQVQTIMRNCISIWIAARNVEWTDSTDLAELVFSCMCSKRVGRKIIFSLYSFHLVSWDDKVKILAHHTD
jgi:hypothetical protein